MNCSRPQCPDDGGAGRTRMLRDDRLPSPFGAEHIMAMPAVPGRRWSVREVRQLIEEAPLATPRYELVAGGGLGGPPPPPPPHNAVGVPPPMLIPSLRQQPLRGG